MRKRDLQISSKHTDLPKTCAFDGLTSEALIYRRAVFACKRQMHLKQRYLAHWLQNDNLFVLEISFVKVSR